MYAKMLKQTKKAKYSLTHDKRSTSHIKITLFPGLLHLDATQPFNVSGKRALPTFSQASLHTYTCIYTYVNTLSRFTSLCALRSWSTGEIYSELWHRAHVLTFHCMNVYMYVCGYVNFLIVFFPQYPALLCQLFGCV